MFLFIKTTFFDETDLKIALLKKFPDLQLFLPICNKH